MPKSLRAFGGKADLVGVTGRYDVFFSQCPQKLLHHGVRLFARVFYLSRFTTFQRVAGIALFSALSSDLILTPSLKLGYPSQWNIQHLKNGYRHIL